MVVGLGEVGFELERAAIRRDGLVALTSLPEGVAQVDVDLRKVWIDLERVAIRGNGFLEPASILERVAQIVVGLRVVGFEVEGETIRGDGVLDPALVLERISQVIPGVRVGWIDLESAAKVGDGGVRLAEGAAGFAEVGVSHGVLRLDGDGFLNPLHRDFVAAELVRDDAEEVQGVGVVWLHREDLAVERLGIGQATGLVMLNRDLKCLGNRHSLLSGPFRGLVRKSEAPRFCCQTRGADRALSPRRRPGRG